MLQCEKNNKINWDQERFPHIFYFWNYFVFFVGEFLVNRDLLQSARDISWKFLLHSQKSHRTKNNDEKCFWDDHTWELISPHSVQNT